MAITNRNYDNIFYKTQLFCSSYFLTKELDYILYYVKWSGGAACPHCGVLGRDSFFCFFSFWGGGGGGGVLLFLLLRRFIAFAQADLNAKIFLLGELQLVAKGLEDAFTLPV